jgi:hypothetical protein
MVWGIPLLGVVRSCGGRARRPRRADDRRWRCPPSSPPCVGRHGFERARANGRAVEEGVEDLLLLLLRPLRSQFRGRERADRRGRGVVTSEHSRANNPRVRGTLIYAILLPRRGAAWWIAQTRGINFAPGRRRSAALQRTVGDRTALKASSTLRKATGFPPAASPRADS